MVTAPRDPADLCNLVCLSDVVLELLLDVSICVELNPTGVELKLLVIVLVEIAAALDCPWCLPLAIGL